MRVLYLAAALAVAGVVAWFGPDFLAPAPEAVLAAPPFSSGEPVSPETASPDPAPGQPPLSGASASVPAPAADPPVQAIPDPRETACLARAGTDPRTALREAEALIAAGVETIGSYCAAAAELALGRPREAAARLERLGTTAEAPSQLRAAWLAQAGQAWLMAGDAERGHAAATLALVLVPDEPDLLIDRAIAAATLGRPFEAIDDLNKVIDLDPARAEAFVYRASAWRQAGRRDLAADDLGRALALDPGNPEAFLERGMLRAAGGDLAGARGDLLRAAELAPGTPTEELARAELEALGR